jgi:hypothetical protein
MPFYDESKRKGFFHANCFWDWWSTFRFGPIPSFEWMTSGNAMFTQEAFALVAGPLGSEIYFRKLIPLPMVKA